VTKTATPQPRPYHHGDLRRALLGAAETVLGREGPAALSLRAVAREAGVSPAAPYHHFRDKSDLLASVAADGFARLKDAMAQAVDGVAAREKGSRMGVAYVAFAQANPALYRIMYDCARDGAGLPEDAEAPDGAYRLVKDTLSEAAGGQLGELDLELTAIACWCAAHGLAEMSKFAKFEPLRVLLGGEQAFVQAVLDHIGVMRRPKSEGPSDTP